MRPPSFASDEFRQYLLDTTVADLGEMKRDLGNPSDVTVFRKLRELDALTCYSYRRRFYTLREIARFDADGLWSFDVGFVDHALVWFSRHGTLVATAEAFVKDSPQGYFAHELAQALHVEVQDALRQLVQRQRISRELVSGLYLYTSADPATRQRQRLTRRRGQTVPTIPDPSRLEVSPDAAKAAVLLFYSLLDEQQRRLYAGLESLKLGRGGDSLLAEFLDLDPHTVARGRQQLLDQDVELARLRKSGGGRKPSGSNRRL